MEVSAEAKRIMVVALGKLYSSRSQRGGLRLHRSLLLTLVMKSARDMYHAAQATAESAGLEWEQRQPAAEPAAETTGAHAELHQSPASPAGGEPRTLPREEEEETAAAVVVAGAPTEMTPVAQDKENVCPSGPAQHSRKRRGKAAVEPDFLPCKKAKLEQANCPQKLVAKTVLMDYVNCSSELGAAPTPMALHNRAIAAC